ncbi:phosphoribosylaminoimidazolesuccinocarboxamide synthase [Nocardia terpenica]|uniref:phosphoribosylaminoimidazolesuccinocarboxamide synthase n=1 Tax=Nocardia terpenica TaxID=455432 RepID=A0A291RFW9_9NOCA|nr:phosphoribosylaminoimidazolesuccinocarboxamide synthase [Nocardia terpenica]ATL66199.1 SAICAR synthetase [Nocardia terpenica]
MKRWSSKDLKVLVPPVGGRPGEGIFVFSDRYSVFDFGVMPDEIPGKGAASCAMAVRSFELFEQADIWTHFLEQVADNAIRIQLLDVDTDGSKGPAGPGRTIPLQVVYRLALPRESSVHRRAAAGTLDHATVPPYGDAGAPWLAEPMVEFTTKYEETDRFIGRAEAARVGGVDPADLAVLTELTTGVARVLERHCAAVGLTLADGKAEFGFDGDRRPILIDHAGTPDENRFYLGATPVCKELLRFLHPGLREVVQRLVADRIPRDRWPRPEPLAPDLVAATAEIYAALAAAWTTGPAVAERLHRAVEDFVTACGNPADLRQRTGLTAAPIGGAA